MPEVEIALGTDWKTFLKAGKWDGHVFSHFSRVWLCDPMDCSLPGSSAHRILWARIVEWIAISFHKMTTQGLEKLWHIPGNLEDCVHFQSYAHAQERPEKTLISPLCLTLSLWKPERKSKVEL